MLRELAFISSCGQDGAGAASRPHSLYRPTKDNARKHGLAWPGWCLAGVSLYVKVCVHPPLLTLNVITPGSGPVASSNFC